jgi:hypothetical protein
MSRGFTLRAGALLAAGALLVHEGRYLVGYGHQADDAIASQGHAYLAWLLPLVVLALAAAGGALITRLARAGASDAARSWAFRRVWLGATTSLLAIYSIQESIEGALAPGHPGGVAALVSNGGWSAAPIALAVGALIALLARGARAAERVAAEAIRPWTARTLAVPRDGSKSLPQAPDVLPRTRLIAFALAGRAPPVS